MAALDKVTLPAWVRVGEECQWWSKSQFTYHPIVVTSIDFLKRRIVVHFKENQKIWKTVPFSQMGSDGPMRPPKSTSWSLVDITAEGGTSTPPWHESLPNGDRDAVEESGKQEELKEDDSSEEDAATTAVTWYDKLRQRREEEAQEAESRPSSTEKHDSPSEATLLPPAAIEKECKEADDDAVADEAWVQLEDASGQTYFWNRMHNSTGWVLPQGVKAKWTGEKSTNGRTYYYNDEGQTVWILPPLANGSKTTSPTIVLPEASAAEPKPESDAAPTVVSLDAAELVEPQKTSTLIEICEDAGPAAPEAVSINTQALAKPSENVWNMAVQLVAASAEPVAPPAECAPEAPKGAAEVARLWKAAQAAESHATTAPLLVSATSAQPVEPAVMLAPAAQEGAPQAKSLPEVEIASAPMEPRPEVATVSPAEAAKIACAQGLWHRTLKKKGAAAFLWKQALQKASGSDEASDEVAPEFPLVSDGRCVSAAASVYSSLVTALWTHIGKEAQQPWMDKADHEQDGQSSSQLPEETGAAAKKQEGIQEPRTESPDDKKLEVAAPIEPQTQALPPVKEALVLPAPPAEASAKAVVEPLVSLGEVPVPPQAILEAAVAPVKEVQTQEMQLQMQVAMLRGELEARKKFKLARQESTASNTNKSSGEQPGPPATDAKAKADADEAELKKAREEVAKAKEDIAKAKADADEAELKKAKEEVAKAKEDIAKAELKRTREAEEQKAKVASERESGLRTIVAASSEKVGEAKELKVDIYQGLHQQSKTSKAADEEQNPAEARAAPLPPMPPPSTPSSLAPMPPPSTPPPSTPSAWAGYAASTAYWGYYHPSTWGGYASLPPLPPPPCDSEGPLPPPPPLEADKDSKLERKPLEAIDNTCTSGSAPSVAKEQRSTSPKKKSSKTSSKKRASVGTLKRKFAEVCQDAKVSKRKENKAPKDAKADSTSLKRKAASKTKEAESAPLRRKSSTSAKDAEPAAAEKQSSDVVDAAKSFMAAALSKLERSRGRSSSSERKPSRSPSAASTNTPVRSPSAASEKTELSGSRSPPSDRKASRSPSATSVRKLLSQMDRELSRSPSAASGRKASRSPSAASAPRSPSAASDRKASRSPSAASKRQASRSCSAASKRQASRSPSAASCRKASRSPSAASAVRSHSAASDRKASRSPSAASARKASRSPSTGSRRKASRSRSAASVRKACRSPSAGSKRKASRSRSAASDRKASRSPSAAPDRKASRSRSRASKRPRGALALQGYCMFKAAMANVGKKGSTVRKPVALVSKATQKAPDSSDEQETLARTVHMAPEIKDERVVKANLKPRPKGMFQAAMANVHKNASDVRKPLPRASDKASEGTDELLGKFLTKVRHGDPPGNWRSGMSGPPAAWLGA